MSFGVLGVLFTVVAVTLAVTLLLRNLPAAIRAMRAPKEAGTNGIISIVNVLLAFAILITAAIQSLAGAGLGR